MELIGRVTKDATISETKAGKPACRTGRKVVNFSIAINDTYKTKGSDEVVKLTTYVNCAYWIYAGIATYLTKGVLVECAGRIGVNAWTGKDGDAKATLTFHVNNIKLHGGNARTINDIINPVSTTPLATATEDLPF
jgi:single-strand DNA-binding protein